MKFRSRLALMILLAGFAATSLWAAGASDNNAPQAFLFPYTWVGKILKHKQLDEPSGIVYHPERRTLFVVGDEGDIAEIDTDGKIKRAQKLRRGADLEGITLDTKNGYLYAVVEDTETILEVDIDTFKIRREFRIDRKLGKKTILRPNDNEGFEAVTYVPTPGRGTLFVANQSYDNAPQNPSVICAITLPLERTERKIDLKMDRCFNLGIPDLSALHYDTKTGHLLVVSDATNTIYQVTLAGRIVNFWAFPGDEQEGLAIDENNFMYIAQDIGGVLKIKWLR
jgi:uncharacterized protein YjiK